MLTLNLRNEQWRQVHEDVRGRVTAERSLVTGTSGLVANWSRGGSVIIIRYESVHFCHKSHKIQSINNRSCVEVVVLTNDNLGSRWSVEVVRDLLIFLLVDFQSVDALIYFQQ